MGITRLKRKERRNKTTSRLREQGKKRASLLNYARPGNAAPQTNESGTPANAHTDHVDSSPTSHN